MISASRTLIFAITCTTIGSLITVNTNKNSVNTIDVAAISVLMIIV